MRFLETYSTGDAYDSCQCLESWHDGQVFVVKDEQVIGITDTWPYAVTAETGEVHGITRDLRTLTMEEWIERETFGRATPEKVEKAKKKKSIVCEAITLAITEAKQRGWPLANWAKEKGENQ